VCAVSQQQTAIAERKAFSIEPITYPVLVEKISELSAEYMPLRVNGLDDAKGLKIVHAARMEVKNLRVSVEKRRKELKDESVKYGRQVDAAAKALTDLLAPIEDHLQAEEDAVENEKARIKAAAEEAKRLKLQKRLEDMLAYGIVFKPDWAEAMTDEAWASELKNAKTQFEIRQAEIVAQAEQQKRDAEALAAERERLASIQKQQEAEAARLRAEQQKIEAEKEATRRAAELEKAKAEAAEKARVETEQRIAREAAEKQAAAERKAAQEKADAEAKETARLKAESEKPYREKLISVAVAVEMIPIPFGTASERVALLMNQCATKIRAIANGPLE
jgi:septal ring factor EnvC (AmiA/AmiB activator)